MPFNEKKCLIPTVYCGNKDDVPSDDDSDGVTSSYSKKGSAYECMQKGFGAGMHSERKKTLGASSLQTIKYVNEKHEKSFKKDGVISITTLKQKCRTMTPANISTFLKKHLKKGNELDKKAYNMVLLHLYRNGMASLPSCYQL
jgi:hypothetical protein